MLCGIVVNVAYMQLTKTELRVATDAAARAAGRAFSEFQAVDAAQQYAASTALLNTVAGVPLQIRSGDYDGEVEFGLVQRTNNGYGRYDFVQKDPNAVRAQTERATAVRINGLRNIGSLNGPVPCVLAVCPLRTSGSHNFRPGRSRYGADLGSLWIDGGGGNRLPSILAL